MDYSDPNSVPLILTGKKAYGSGRGVPDDGLIRVRIEAEWRKSRREGDSRFKLYLNLTCLDGSLPGYEIFHSDDLPTPQIQGMKTSNGKDMMEIAERRLKTLLIAKGMDPDVANGLVSKGEMNVAQVLHELNGAEATIWYYAGVKRPDGEYSWADVNFLSPDAASAIRAGTAQPPARFNTDIDGAPSGRVGAGSGLAQQTQQTQGLGASGGLGGGNGAASGGLGAGAGLGGAPRTAQPPGGAAGLVDGLTN